MSKKNNSAPAGLPSGENSPATAAPSVPGGFAAGSIATTLQAADLPATLAEGYAFCGTATAPAVYIQTDTSLVVTAPDADTLTALTAKVCDTITATGLCPIASHPYGSPDTTGHLWQDIEVRNL